MRKQHLTARELVGQTKGWWGLAALLETPEIGDCPTLLEKTFLLAAFGHNDEDAAQLFEWLMESVADVLLVPLLEEDEMGKSALPRNLGSKSEVMFRVRREQAQVAQRLYPVLPKHRIKKQAMGEIRKLTLLGTKRALLQVVAELWCNTGDEEEADRLFAFLIGIESSFTEEKDMLVDVVRKATGHGFPVARLGRHISSTPTGGECPQRIMDVLVVAWARNQTSDCMSLSAQALLPLYERVMQRAANRDSSLGSADDLPLAAFVLLAELARKVAALDVLGEELLGVLKDGGSFRGCRVSVSYPSLDRIEVSTLLTTDVRTREETLHDLFDQAKPGVRAWLDERSKADSPLFVSIKLLTRVHCSRSEPKVFREADL